MPLACCFLLFNLPLALVAQHWRDLGDQEDKLFTIEWLSKFKHGNARYALKSLTTNPVATLDLLKMLVGIEVVGKGTGYRIFQRQNFNLHALYFLTKMCRILCFLLPLFQLLMILNHQNWSFRYVNRCSRTSKISATTERLSLSNSLSHVNQIDNSIC